MATKFSPHIGETSARLANFEAAKGEDADFDRVREAAEDALLIDLSYVSALRNRALAAEAEGELELARELMRHSYQVSRRDLASHIWLMRDAARRGDLDETLRQFDEALRSSRRAWGVLPPILLPALADDQSVESIADLIASGPGWETPFLNYVARQASDPERAAALLLAVDDRGSALPRSAVAPTIARLAQRGDYVVAADLFEKAGGRAVDADGTISLSLGELPPFDWQLEPEAAAVTVGDPPTNGISIDVVRGAEGLAAWRFLKLAPGSYAMRASYEVFSSRDGDRVAIAISCAEGRSLVRADGELTGSEVSVSGSFEIPEDCAIQRVELQFERARSIGSTLSAVLTDLVFDRV